MGPGEQNRGPKLHMRIHFKLTISQVGLFQNALIKDLQILRPNSNGLSKKMNEPLLYELAPMVALAYSILIKICPTFWVVSAYIDKNLAIYEYFITMFVPHGVVIKGIVSRDGGRGKALEW
jgi:hypothetical protein